MRKVLALFFCLTIVAGWLLFRTEISPDYSEPNARSQLPELDSQASPGSELEIVDSVSKGEPEDGILAGSHLSPPEGWPGARVLAYTEKQGASGTVIREWVLDGGREDLPIRRVEKGTYSEDDEFQILAHRDMAAHRVLINPTSPHAASLLEGAFPLSRVERIGMSGSYLISRSEYDLDTVPELMSIARSEPELALVEPDYVVRSSLTPNDPLFSQQWALSNNGSIGTAGVDMDAPLAWDIRTTASNGVIAVIDTGLRTSHQDIASNLWINPNEVFDGLDNDGNGYVDDINGLNSVTQSNAIDDDDGHGTHVAGISAAQGNNGVGITGVAWDAQIMAVKFLVNGQGSTSDAIRGIDYAIGEGAQVINASWGGPGDSFSLQQAIVRARNAGIPFIAAAGNETANNDVTSSYPANYDLDNVVSVGSSTATDSRSSFSNYGLESVDLFAPGSSILSTWHTSDSAYQTLSGTSMAAPQVAGAMALIAAQFPAENYNQWIARMMSSVDRPAALSNLSISSGRLNLANALGQSSSELPPVIIQSLTNQVVEVGGSVTLSVIVNSSSPLTYSWSKDGTIISGENNSSLTINPVTALSSGFYQVTVSNAAGSTNSSAIVSILDSELTLTSALDDSNRSWLTTGNAPWLAQSTSFIVGGSATVSADIGNFEESSIQTTVEGPGTVCFWWRTSSEEFFDFLIVTLNGITVGFISGETEWREVCFQVPAGTNTIAWQYFKDGSVSFGNDAGYLDGFSFASNGASGPNITSQPKSDVVAPGESHSFAVEVEGDGPFSYQWLKDGFILLDSGTISGANSSTLFLNSVSEDNAGLYAVQVTNAIASATSSTVQLTVDQGLPPQITTQPRDATLGAGEDLSLSVVVDGSSPFNFQWFKDDQAIVGENSFSLDLNNVDLNDSGQYYVEVSNDSGTTISESAEIVVIEASIIPVVLKHPADAFAQPGDSLTLQADVGGSEPMSYQWYKDNQPLAAQTAVNLTLAETEPADSGEYYLEASNDFGTATSRLVFVTIAGGQDALRLALNIDQPIELTSNSNPWFIQQNETDSDLLALQSAPVTDGQTSVLSTYLFGPGRIYFRWKVSSEESMDLLQFRVNGITRFSTSGEIDWETRSWDLDEGIHRIEWVYLKNSSGSSGSDAGFLDRLFLGEGITILTASNYFQGSAELGNGWYFVQGLGSIYGDNFRWIFHLEHDWLFMSGEGGVEYWVYDPAMGWFFTANDLYPFLFSQEVGTWLFYVEGTSNPRIFINNATGQVLQFP